MWKWICSFTPRYLASMKSNSSSKRVIWYNLLLKIYISLPIHIIIKNNLMDYFLFHSKYFITVHNCQETLSILHTACLLCLYTIFCIFDLLHALDYFSSSLLNGVGPGWNKSMYEIFLSLIRSINERQFGDKFFIFSQNDNGLKDLPTTLILCSVFIRFSIHQPHLIHYSCFL